MDYLFFDTESAHGTFHRGVMCSFGYVLCNENFDVIEEDDILINPEIEDRSWDWYVVKNILAYNRCVYKSMSSFPAFYERIKQLLTRPNTMIINHGIENDAIIIASTIRRYKLEQFDYHFYDSALFYKRYKNEKNTKNLDTVSLEVCFEDPRDKHPSLEDAQRVYRIMRTLSTSEGMTIEELFKEHSYCDGEVKEGRLHFIRPSIVSKLTENKITKSNRFIVKDYCREIEVTDNEKSRFNKKKFSIDANYAKTHLMETIYIAKKMANLGAKMIFKASVSNIYVRCNLTDAEGNVVESEMTKYAKEAIDEGMNIEIIDIDDFLKEIDFNMDEVEDAFDEFKDYLGNRDNKN